MVKHTKLRRNIEIFLKISKCSPEVTLIWSKLFTKPSKVFLVLQKSLTYQSKFNDFYLKSLNIVHAKVIFLKISTDLQIIYYEI